MLTKVWCWLMGHKFIPWRLNEGYDICARCKHREVA